MKHQLRQWYYRVCLFLGIYKREDFVTVSDVLNEAYKELLYVAQKTAERTKKEIVSKGCEWLKEKNKLCIYELEMILGGNFIKDFKKAMEEQL